MFFNKKINTLMIGLSLGSMSMLSEVVKADETVKSVDNPLAYEAKGYTLAEIQLSNGNVVKFVEVPEMETVFMGEIVQAGPNEAFVLDKVPGSYLQKFLQLTNKDVPVPQALIDISVEELINEESDDGVILHADAKVSPYRYESVLGEETAYQLNQRQIAVELSAPVSFDLENLGLALPAAQKSGSGSCNNSTGYQYFKDNHCGTSGNWGYGKSEGYCDNGMSSWVQRTSKINMRNTYTRHATCGVGQGRVKHSRKSGSSFNTHFTSYSSANTVEDWQSKKSSLFGHKRRVNVDKLAGSGYIRSWVKYYKQLIQ